MRYSKVSVPAADPPSAVAKVKLTPSTRDDTYNEEEPDINVAAAALVGISNIIEDVFVVVFGMVFDAAALMVNEPVEE
jgi:hypothetical protein